MTQGPDPVDAFSLLKGRPEDTAQMKRLRFAVIGMSVLLAAGFATVIGRIFYLMTRTPPPTEADIASSAPLASDLQVLLPEGAHAIQQSISGGLLSVLHEGPQGQGVVIIDLKSGRETGRVRIKPSPK